MQPIISNLHDIDSNTHGDDQDKSKHKVAHESPEVSKMFNIFSFFLRKRERAVFNENRNTHVYWFVATYQASIA